MPEPKKKKIRWSAAWAEARDLICDAYETFKEGFQTADLADAQAMLGE